MPTTPDPVQIPSKAVSDEADLRQPVRALLEDLYLLGNKEDTEDAGKFTAAFTGPPQSVALIEVGATAAAKWWSAGLGASVIAIWGSVSSWWPTESDTVKAVVAGGALFVTAALVIAIGYLIASDVSGRAAASVSLIEARARVATHMIQAAQAVHIPTSDASSVEFIALPSPVPVKNHRVTAADQDHWVALGIKGNEYLVVKGSREETHPASELDFGP